MKKYEKKLILKELKKKKILNYDRHLLEKIIDNFVKFLIGLEDDDEKIVLSNLNKLKTFHVFGITELDSNEYKNLYTRLFNNIYRQIGIDLDK